ncbi:histidine phosphatase family protein [Alteromonas sp. C1M14]|uniref:SixA phosphatase family protein n=1 Tax=Alteromonas sp. C1M14 TaxID=2841567 RepID=UPI002091AB59|nr:histidine phosphatase family protein [Alteromonas sp. C1M14]
MLIMRHGEAESLRIDDKSRQLTEHGRHQVSQSAGWLIENYCRHRKIDLALVSPYRRTRQTYDMLSLDFSIAKSMQTDDIVPEANPQLAHDYVNTLIASSQSRTTPVSTILLVSHMPFVSYFVDEVCATPVNSLFATGSVAVVSYNAAARRGRLLSHYQGTV